MIGLYIVGYVIITLSTYVFIKLKIDFGVVDWSNVIARFIFSSIWPLSWVLIVLLVIIEELNKLMKQHKPPKWL